MKRSEAVDLVAVLRAAYPTVAFTERTCQVYEAMLADLDFGLAQLAIARHVATSRWLPTVAEIRAAAADQQHGPRRIGADAWGDVVAEIRCVGAYGRPRFADATVARCVDSMGWRTLCGSTNDAADRARFVELYDNISTRERAEQIAEPALKALVSAGSLIALPEAKS